MTAILIFISVLIAAVLAIWLVIRSREEPGGRSGVDAERTGDGGAPLGDQRTEPRGAGDPSGATERTESAGSDRRKDVERLRQEDAERPGD